ncbi:MAG: indole-3-glycerol-phosphate synthase [Nitrososphaera sp.]
MSRFSKPAGYIEKLADNAYRAIDEGVYSESLGLEHGPISMRKSLLSASHTALITEVKYSSPSKGRIRNATNGPAEIASAMVKGGAAGLSVLTQPYLFNGSLGNLASVRKNTTVPLMMKDIIVSRVQIDAGKGAGADCILLIKSLFDRDLAEESLDSLVDYARRREIEVLPEAFTPQEYSDLISSAYPLVGINNRNLDTLEIDLRNTELLIKSCGKGKSLVISESGVGSAEDVRRLNRAGADAFLVGTSIMASDDISSKVSELYHAL